MELIRKSEEKNLRISIYFDCICGSISAIISLSCIIFFAIVEGIESPGWFTVGLTFWISWLIFSIFLISLGIYTYLREKHFDEKKQKKKLKAPIVS
ncbi:MAG: hypothetical protein ACFFBV_06360 [Promethearchaeota archaeon]